MAAPKRTTTERERDRRLIAEYYLTGRSIYQITDELNARQDVTYTLSSKQVWYDLRLIRERWVKSGLRDFDKAQAQEIERIDRLEREHWAAWRMVDPTDRTAPSYLAGVMRCIERRCKILGLDAPVRQELTGKGGGPIETKDVSDPDSNGVALLMALYERVRARAVPGDGNGDGAVDAASGAPDASLPERGG
jgi:hypothetical protein